MAESREASMDAYRTSAIHTPNLIVCGIAPKNRLVTFDKNPCDNCNGTRVLRIFSGSGWYEDDLTCMDCGESGTGYRPFRRGWRNSNIAAAEKWLDQVIPYGLFHQMTSAAIREEMQWETEED